MTHPHKNIPHTLTPNTHWPAPSHLPCVFFSVSETLPLHETLNSRICSHPALGQINYNLASSTLSRPLRLLPGVRPSVYPPPPPLWRPWAKESRCPLYFCCLPSGLPTLWLEHFAGCAACPVTGTQAMFSCLRVAVFVPAAHAAQYSTASCCSMAACLWPTQRETGVTAHCFSPHTLCYTQHTIIPFAHLIPLTPHPLPSPPPHHHP